MWRTRLLREWTLVVGAVLAALFGANDTLQIAFAGDTSRFAFLLAFVVFAGWVIMRVSQLQAALDEREAYKRTLATVENLLLMGSQVLGECGFDRESMHGYTSPKGRGAGYGVWFSEVASPKIMAFGMDARKRLGNCATNYLGTFENVGNVLHGTADKPAMLQQLEGWLRQLEKIADDLRGHLK